MNSVLRIALGRTVRALRATAGYSQEGFADAIGVHRTYMGTLERGDGNPTLETLERIAQGLHIAVSELLRGAETGLLPTVAQIHPSSSTRRRGGPPPLGRVAEPSNPDRP